jgi:hypothetical protein
MTLEHYLAMPDGPAKKFYLIKHFGDRLRYLANRDPRELSCAALAALLKTQA